MSPERATRISRNRITPKRRAKASRTVCMPPIVAALIEAEKFLSANGTWSAARNSSCVDQERFLRDVLKTCRKAVPSMSEIEAMASDQPEPLVEFLRKRGFSMQFDPFNDGDFGVAAVFKMIMKWMLPGTELLVDAFGQQFPGFRLERTQGVGFAENPRYRFPVARIPTQEGDQVYIAKASDEFRDALDFNLLFRAKELVEGLQPIHGFGGVRVPMVDLDQQVNIGWLCGMTTDAGPAKGGGEYRIAQAMQQTKLKMNHLGAKVESAVAVQFALNCARMPKPDLVIDDTFLMIVKHKSLDLPVFVGIIEPADWKDPGDEAVE